MSTKMVIPGFVLMVATPGEDITGFNSTLTIITSHVPHSQISQIRAAHVSMDLFYQA